MHKGASERTNSNARNAHVGICPGQIVEIWISLAYFLRRRALAAPCSEYFTLLPSAPVSSSLSPSSLSFSVFLRLILATCNNYFAFLNIFHHVARKLHQDPHGYVSRNPTTDVYFIFILCIQGTVTPSSPTPWLSGELQLLKLFSLC